ncbi:MAG: iron-containing alcohol dehydrogenase [Candidatus Bathyarchaeota archaeon]
MSTDKWSLYKPEGRYFFQAAFSYDAAGVVSLFICPRIFTGSFGLNFLITVTSAMFERKKAFIVTDKTIKHLTFKVESILKLNGFQVYVWDKVELENPLEKIFECAKEMLNFQPDLIVAVGGGSHIDTAKAAWILYERPEINLKEVNPFIPLLLRRKALLLAIPTTSGTGSDSTAAIVITDNSFKPPLKAEVVHPEVVPDFSVLDPDMVINLPRNLTIGTALDALAHAFDSYISPAASEFTEVFAVKAIKLVFEWLPKVLEHPDNKEARFKVHKAATIAGIAFSNGGASLTHALGHPFGKIFGIHHGFSVGVFIPYMVGYYSKTTDRCVELARELNIEALNDEDFLVKLENLFLDFYRKIDAPTKLSDLKVDEKEFLNKLEVLSRYAVEDVTTVFSPRPLSIDDAKKLFLDAYHGRRVRW